ncbi:hypothetical protein RUM44_005699 [Polyplax serrata]|uniref:Uncharacterized protein n=1 Tax=Polyplax serrata TaxID=468196 RepID=A0ABR1AWB2_POLSC
MADRKAGNRVNLKDRTCKTKSKQRDIHPWDLSGTTLHSFTSGPPREEVLKNSVKKKNLFEENPTTRNLRVTDRGCVKTLNFISFPCSTEFAFVHRFMETSPSPQEKPEEGEQKVKEQKPHQHRAEHIGWIWPLPNIQGDMPAAIEREKV